MKLLRFFDSLGIKNNAKKKRWSWKQVPIIPMYVSAIKYYNQLPNTKL